MAIGLDLPLMVIAGPTASGKTALAIKLAKKYNGEIICADSRTVYKGMDIGTAKPTKKERVEVTHWGLDIVSPGERFSVADFKKYALERIVDIRSRGKTPFLVGGTGLYIDAVVFDYSLTNDTHSRKLREDLTSLDINALQEYCIKNNINIPHDMHNKRRIIRNIEKQNNNDKRRPVPLDNTIIVGITTSKDFLRTNIRLRAEQLIYEGVVDETTKLSVIYGWDSEAMTANIYRLVRRFINRELSKGQLAESSTIADCQLAKRQMTWFRRNPYIIWGSLKDCEHYLSDRLANK